MFRFNAAAGDIKIAFQYRSAVIAYDRRKMLTENRILSEDTDIPVFDLTFGRVRPFGMRLQAGNGQSYEEEYNE